MGPGHGRTDLGARLDSLAARRAAERLLRRNPESIRLCVVLGGRGGWTVSREASCYTHAEAARPGIAFRCVNLDNAGGTRIDVTSHPPRAPLVRLQDALRLSE